MTAAVLLQHLTVYYETTCALSDISLEIREREFVGIVGPNGGGKSTLVKAILGLIPIESGSISLLGGSVHENRKKVGYVPQFAEIDRQFPISVIEAVQSACLTGGLHPFYRKNAENKKHAEEQLKRVGIAHLANRQIAELSGGEFQRVLIARALAVNPEILVLDEPDASIDLISREEIYRLLSSLNKQITIILVTHDHMAISSAVTSLVCLHQRLIYYGSPDIPDSVFREMYGGIHA